MINRFSTAHFRWENWRAGSIQSLGIPCRKECMINAANIIRKHAVGYCKSDNIKCRPKQNQIALMCHKDGEHFWFHMRKDEFNEVFKGDANEA